MKPIWQRRGGILAGFVLAVAAFAGGIWWLAFRAELDQLRARGQADLALAADRLTAQFQRVRDLAVLLADHPGLTPLVLDGAGSDAAAGRAGDLLQRFTDRSGARAIWLADARGRVLAASGALDGGARSFAGRAAFERASDGALGIEHGLDAETGARYFAFAAPVFSAEGPVAGAVQVRVDIDAVEWNWPADPSPVFFTDALGVVLVANRSDLVLTRRGGGEAAGAARLAEVYGGAALPDFPLRAHRMVADKDIWTLPDSPYLPATALHLTQPLPVIGLTAEILMNLAPVRQVATLQAAVAAALCLMFGALLFVLAERRRALAQRLRLEERANAMLEARVAERTAELSSANDNLRREIGERREAEAALKRAQADLVQAGKLSALGQMSAGISHELNQPLMAIQSFAENGAILLERGQADKAADTLSRISDMARRMGRIIRNLRAFARQESGPAGRVGLAGVVDSAIEMLAPRIAQTGTEVDWRPPGAPALARGGEVRLTQVVVNLMANAMDAMAGCPDPRIELRITEDPARGLVRLTVRDTGPGLDEPGRIFDPFYTTKDVGAGRMGLGLSISYGLVQGFGGRLTGGNAPGGGAVFTVELQAAAQAAA